MKDWICVNILDIKIRTYKDAEYFILTCKYKKDLSLLN